MGKIHDALKKAEREREAKRGGGSQPSREASVPSEPRVDEAPEAPRPGPKPRPESKRSRESVAAEPRSDEPAPATRSRPASNKGMAAVLARSPVELVTRGPATRQYAENLIARLEPSDSRVEQFRLIKTNIQALEPSPRLFVVTSAVRGEGRRVMASNLAVTFAEGSVERVLYVEGDIRRRSENLFGIPDGLPGVSDVLAGEADPQDVIVETGIPDVYYAPQGKLVHNPGSALSRATVPRALDAWREAFDRVLLVAPPVAEVNDPNALGLLVDGVVFVIRLGGTPRKLAERAVETMAAAGVDLIGCVLTDSGREARFATSMPPTP